MFIFRDLKSNQCCEIHKSRTKTEIKSHIFPWTVIHSIVKGLFFPKKQLKRLKRFWALVYHFIKKKKTKAFRLKLAVLGGNMKALTAHCRANRQGAWERLESSRCISGTRTYFLDVLEAALAPPPPLLLLLHAAMHLWLRGGPRQSVKRFSGLSSRLHTLSVVQPHPLEKKVVGE